MSEHKRDFPPTGRFSGFALMSRRVGPGTDGRVSEHKRDFPPAGRFSGFALMSRRVGKGFPTHGLVFRNYRN